MKARVVYKAGWRLEIPKEGWSSTLLLEWLSGFRAAKSPLHLVATDNASSIIVVKFQEGTTKEVYQNCAAYINANN